MTETPAIDETGTDTIASAPHAWFLSPYEATLTREKVEKINARAEKRGFAGRLTIDVSEPFTSKTIDENTGLTVERVLCKVTLGGDAPCYDGWVFVATLDWDANAGLIVRSVAGADPIDRDAVVEGHCDHCKSKRQRKNTYVVVNRETGEQLQIGSSCIKDFLGWDTRPVILVAKDVEDELEGYIGGLDRVQEWTIGSVLAITWAVVKATGGFKPSSSYDTPTREHVMDVLAPGKSKYAREFAESIRPHIADAEAKATVIRAFILSDAFSGGSDYVSNMKALLAAEYVSARNLGYAVSAVSPYLKAQEHALEAKARDEKPSEHFGTEGEKVPAFTGVIERINYSENFRGDTVVWYTIRDAETGRIVEWKASREALGEDTGVTVTIKGTIKGHGEYRGVKRTQMTRCKLVSDIIPVAG